jgi:hypothetical protein
MKVSLLASVRGQTNRQTDGDRREAHFGERSETVAGMQRRRENAGERARG